MLRESLRTLCCAAVGAATLSAQEPAEANTKGEESAPVEASAVRVEELLESWEQAVEGGDALALAEVLAEMGAHTNAEFLEPGLAGLGYRASKLDEQAAKDEAVALGLREKVEVDRRVEHRVGEVQAAAARLLASVPGKRNGKLLHETLNDGAVRSKRPRALLAVLDALGRLRFAKAEGDVFDLLRRFEDPQVSTACIRYFGQARTKSLEIVLFLCEQLEPPKPAWVDDPSNPPPEYWEQRWKSWQAMRRDVTWSLREITGETFRCAEGVTPGEKARALEFVEAKKRDLGLK